MAKVFKVAPKNRAVIEFSFEDENYLYTFTPPKVAGVVLSVIEGGMDEAKAAFDWLSDGLPEDQNAHLIARLRDQQDALDIDDIGPMVEGLMEEMGERPTS
jgi:hypothetical protein